MPAYTSANFAQAIVKQVAAEALPALVAKLVMGALVNRDYEPVLAQAGDTVNVPIPPVLVANNIAEAGSVVPQNPSLGNAQIVLNTHKETTFNMPDASRVLAVPDLIKTLLDPAMKAMAEAIEQDLLNLYPNFTVNTAVGGASTVDEARVDLAETTLFNQKIPPTTQKYLVVNGATYGAMRQLPRFTDFQNVGPSGQPSPQMTGVLPGGVADGKLKDFLVFRSQLVAKPSTTTYNLAFARDAIGLVMRRLPMPMPGTGAIAEYAELGGFGLRVIMSYQPNSLSQQFTVDALYGCGVLRNSFGLQMQTNN